jgi:hypothetical protein
MPLVRIQRPPYPFPEWTAGPYTIMEDKRERCGALFYSSYPSAVTTPSARSRTTQVAMQALKRPASLPVAAPLP